jgi:hypothetical protein
MAVKFNPHHGYYGLNLLEYHFSRKDVPPKYISLIALRIRDWTLPVVYCHLWFIFVSYKTHSRSLLNALLWNSLRT